MKKIFCFLINCLFIFGLLAGCATYPDYGGVEVRDENVRVKVGFGENDRQLIHNYYKSKHKHMPPGLAKKRKLPPGLQKQLVRKGKLPPGLEGRHLPYELERKLSPLPGGYIRLRVGGDVLILDEVTRVIVDIIYNVGY